MVAISLVKPTVNKAAVIRAELKAAGIKANVRYFNWSYRIVLPVWTQQASDALRDFAVLNNLRLAGFATSPTDRAAYERAWSKHDGRGQIFFYDVR